MLITIGAILAGITLIIGFIIYNGSKNIDKVFADDYKKFNSISKGMEEHSVIELLGNPQKSYHAPNYPSDYYIPGYSFKRRDISNKVFIYIGTEAIAYIYINDQNKVEDIFVGGS